MYFALEPGVGFALNFLVGVSLCFTARLKRTEPRVQLDHQVSKTVWKDAALAAVSALQSGSNATTILMPSGAGDVQVGLETVWSFVDTTGLPHFRIVVAIPSSLASAAQKLYAETFAEDSIRLVTRDFGYRCVKTSNNKCIKAELLHNSAMPLWHDVEVRPCFHRVQDQDTNGLDHLRYCPHPARWRFP